MKKSPKPRNATDKLPTKLLTFRVLSVVAVGVMAIGAVIGFSLHATKSRSAATTALSKPSECESCPSAGAITFAPRSRIRRQLPGAAPAGMVWIPGGEFSMGSTVRE
jgi:formylglycine-generating enzyme required for sulfatase activity